jgi:hypothetical protein
MAAVLRDMAAAALLVVATLMSGADAVPNVLDAMGVHHPLLLHLFFF